VPTTFAAGDASIIKPVTTDLRRGEPVWWVEGDPHEVLAASACLPGLFAPVPLAGSLHVDGGVVCPVPIQRALDLGAERVWVLDVSSDVTAGAWMTLVIPVALLSVLVRHVRDDSRRMSRGLQRR